MAQAASTALPPFWKIIAPAVAPSGLPVMATQCRPCSGGFCVAAMIRTAAHTGGPHRCDRITSMVSFELAGSVANANQILIEWSQATRLGARQLREELRKAILYDFAFIPLYASAIGLACLAVV